MLMNPKHRSSVTNGRTTHRYFDMAYNTVLLQRDTLTILIFPSYGLNDRVSRVRLLAGAGNFSLHHRVQNGSGAHPSSYPMGTRGSFPGGKAAGA
jgi:hypothetical protein